jgi:hypothetical protein
MLSTHSSEGSFNTGKQTDYEAECIVDYSHKMGAVDWTGALLSYV